MEVKKKIVKIIDWSITVVTEAPMFMSLAIVTSLNSSKILSSVDRLPSFLHLFKSLHLFCKI